MDTRFLPGLLLLLAMTGEHVEHSFVEAGVRYQATPFLVLTPGLGAGFADESPDVRAIVGFQLSF